ncbi:MAG: alanine dehydrogenase [Deltaproteobacteria bacterium]|jgi:alanine dehydrogenase|nr:MAG: alanine dehydrogenase [Deltaproteobacteria bacterium]
MIIGIPRERKVHEYRVSLTPQAVRVLVERGHQVLVERGAGSGSGIRDEEFSRAGARLVDNEESLFDGAELIVKVKEPISEEFPLIRSNHIIFSYLHLAANRDLLEVLRKSRVRAIAFETIELPDGSLPLLAPMSRIAGRLSVQVGMHYLEKPQGGKGVLLGGAPGVKPGKVTVIGGGTVGYNAVITALGLGAEVTVIDKNPKKLEFFHERFSGSVKTLPSYPEFVEGEVKGSDLVIGAVLVTGARAPKVITRNMVSGMEPGSVFVDVAIDQGGCSETSHPTTLDSPVFVVDGVIHYCVTNIPSLVPRTATHALSNAILPYVLKIASGDYENDESIKKGINVDRGEVLLKLD